MALSFDPNVGIVVDSYSEVRENVRYEWQKAFSDEDNVLNVDPETPAGQLIDSQTALICEKDSDILFLANQFNPEYAEGRWQDALARIYFLTRKRAESTVVDCECRGLYGTLIPKGALVQSTGGYQLKALSEAQIKSNGVVMVEFSVTETGPIPIKANTVNKILTVTPGWDSVNNPAPGVLGRNEETRAELETRRYNSVAKNAQGSVASIQAEIVALDGVLDCVVLENATNAEREEYGIAIEPHSVAVSVFGGSDDDIAEAIYKKKSAGCGTSGDTEVAWLDPRSKVRNRYRITRPQSTPLYVKVKFKNSSNITNDIQAVVSAAIVKNFAGQDGNDRVGMAQTLYASRFYATAVTASNVSDLLGIELSKDGESWSPSVTMSALEEPTLSASDVAVELVE